MLFGAVGLPLLLNPEVVVKESLSVVKYVFFVFFGYSLRVVISFSMMLEPSEHCLRLPASDSK